MATQWTAGLSDNTPLPAATLNRIGAAWETWTPNFRPETGAWTTATTTFARYGRIQKLVFGMARLDITAFNTGNGALMFDLPVTAFRGAADSIGTGREDKLSGSTLNVFLFSSTVGGVRFYNNGAPAAANYACPIMFVYEAA